MEQATNIFSKHGNRSSDIKLCWAQYSTDSKATAAQNISKLLTISISGKSKNQISHYFLCFTF